MNFYDLCVWIVIGLIAILLFLSCTFGIASVKYYVDRYRAVPCIEVYDGTELLYRGNEKFSTTESRGTSTMWYQVQERIIFPRKLKERISPNIVSRICQ